MLQLLLDAGQYASENLAVPVGASLATIWASTKVAQRRTVASEIADHDRRAAEINVWAACYNRTAEPAPIDLSALL